MLYHVLLSQHIVHYKDYAPGMPLLDTSHFYRILQIDLPVVE